MIPEPEPGRPPTTWICYLFGIKGPFPYGLILCQHISWPRRFLARLLLGSHWAEPSAPQITNWEPSAQEPKDPPK